MRTTCTPLRPRSRGKRRASSGRWPLLAASDRSCLSTLKKSSARKVKMAREKESTTTDIARALARAEEVAQSLRETLQQARAIEDMAQRLTSAGNENAAATEQMRAALETVAASIEETA